MFCLGTAVGRRIKSEGAHNSGNEQALPNESIRAEEERSHHDRSD
jgi:hypothetical protein